MHFGQWNDQTQYRLLRNIGMIHLLCNGKVASFMAGLSTPGFRAVKFIVDANSCYSASYGASYIRIWCSALGPDETGLR